MSPPFSRLQSVLSHFTPSPSTPATANHINQLSPTFFLQRAAEIEPEAEAIYHQTANGKILRRSYQDFADRARGLAYFIQSQGWKRVGILMPNTPGFLESIFGIAAAGAVNVAVNYRLKTEDIAYIFEFAKVDAILVDEEFVPLLKLFREKKPNVPFVIDLDTDATEGELSGPFDEAILRGLKIDIQSGSPGWEGLESRRIQDEDAMIAIPFTSGTTAKPKGVVYTHRGAYLAALGNVIESGLNYHTGRCGYLWTLPMFHAMGWTFPWAVTAVRGTHFCLRKIDYPLIWKLLKSENITHFNAAPTVNTLLCASKEAEKLENLVRVTVAASPPTAHLFEQMSNLNLYPVHVYGLTETYGPITKGYHMPLWETLPLKEKYARMARQGHGFITGLPIRVIKPDLPEGVLEDVRRDGKEVGEIVFFGNICAKEYLDDKEATRKLFAGGGENISSVALEAMLVQHPDVLEAGVVSVPDSHWGERPKAYITVKEGKSMRGEDLITWAKHESSISKFMVPREVEIVEELPKTSTGKLKKNILRKWAKGDYGES
ncbi:putative 2-succinylbenzoate-CoA ligase [Coleophoma cylindrospora]|uniref:Putative 2-succinylbenzoate-CoA ligase n=1 Tax=Coleophoma cylindrospora TaxID=1849047 RepID=A0A3D8RB05_9HELO|nr:putative 2-succinylbenzoate-CoA ligase [Coleophoma cylindrospora]